MSRIGRMPIPLPDKVKVEAREGAVEVTGPLGKLVQKLPPGVTAKVEQGRVVVEPPPHHDQAGALHGLARSLVHNAVIGVTQGFKKELEIVGLGYRAAVAGDKLTLTLGFARPLEFRLPSGIKAVVDQKLTGITISGVDSYLVGEVASQIRRLKKPEPYKGSGIKYVGEHIIRKAGKAAAGAVGGGAGKK